MIPGRKSSFLRDIECQRQEVSGEKEGGDQERDSVGIFNKNLSMVGIRYKSKACLLGYAVGKEIWIKPEEKGSREVAIIPRLVSIDLAPMIKISFPLMVVERENNRQDKEHEKKDPIEPHVKQNIIHI